MKSAGHFSFGSEKPSGRPRYVAVDAARVMDQPIPEFRWLVERLIPAEGVLDLSGPPGCGKSSIAMSLAVAVANCFEGEGRWLDVPLQAHGPAVIVDFERSGSTSLARDLARQAPGGLRSGRLMVVCPGDSGGGAFLWSRPDRGGEYVPTPFGHEVGHLLRELQPSLVIIDTLLAAAPDQNPIDIPSQYALGRAVMRAAAEIGGAWITLSHTNQASARDPWWARINYMSRGGSNGFPAAIRAHMGVTRLTPEDRNELPPSVTVDSVRQDKILALGVSKANESPPPSWTPESPLLLELTRAGALRRLGVAADTSASTSTSTGQVQGSGRSTRKAVDPGKSRLRDLLSKSGGCS